MSDEDIDRLRALVATIATGYQGGTATIELEDGHAIRLYYADRDAAMRAFDALTDAIDAHVAGRKG
ncbi:MAG TPA: hypothetical protein VEA81_00175 [Burkholderiaceae bacterium]|nr:hypothetical protein [Burkholderiaceae bacterium]